MSQKPSDAVDKIYQAAFLQLNRIWRATVENPECECGAYSDAIDDGRGAEVAAAFRAYAAERGAE